MKKDAILSDCRKYRYALWRIWDCSLPYLLFIGLNPSTADEKKDDPTIRKCIKYAKYWEYGGFYMANLFAFRATDSSKLYKEKKPIGQNNDEWIVKLSKKARIVVAAWGNNGNYLDRSKKVVNMIPDLYCLKKNNSGEPTHPLYLNIDLKPIKM